MNRYLEALERLAMPDDIHIKECEKLGIGLTEDYDLLEQYILKTQERENENARYKQLEEQLGCPLEVVFKALKQDYIYTKSGKHSRIEFGVYGFEWCICYGLRTQIRVDDYKKTWWLKKDKSE